MRFIVRTKRITREREHEGGEEESADRSSIIGGGGGGCYGSIEVLVSKSCSCALLLHTHGQVDEGEDVVLDHDREAEEDGVQDQDVNAQLHVQPPFVQVDPQDLHTYIHTHKHGLASMLQIRSLCAPA